ncbi:MAG: insulinase family protein, partial [Rhodospirillales bacterium]
LDDAKTFLTGSYPLRFLSSDRIASMLVGLQVENLGIDYPDHRNGLIEKVTLDDVNRLARKLLDPKRLTVVVVGKPEGVTSSP